MIRVVCVLFSASLTFSYYFWIVPRPKFFGFMPTDFEPMVKHQKRLFLRRNSIVWILSFLYSFIKLSLYFETHFQQLSEQTKTPMPVPLLLPLLCSPKSLLLRKRSPSLISTPPRHPPSLEFSLPLSFQYLTLSSIIQIHENVFHIRPSSVSFSFYIQHLGGFLFGMEYGKGRG